MTSMKNTDTPGAAPEALDIPDSTGTPPEPPRPPQPSAPATLPAGPELPPSQGLPGKSPVLAVFLALMFLGHFYVGKYQRAVVFITSFFLAIYLIPLPFNIFIAIFIWFFNLFDAHRQTELENLAETSDESRALERRKATLTFGIYLVALGVLLLVDSFYPIEFYWLKRWWPVLLVGSGIYVIWGAVKERKQDTEETSLPVGLID
jgi:hypothetical protein